MSLFSTTAGLHTVRMCALARTRPCFGPRDPGPNTVDVTLAVSTGARDSASDYRQKPVSNLTYQQGCRRNRNHVSQLHGPSACTVAMKAACAIWIGYNSSLRGTLGSDLPLTQPLWSVCSVIPKCPRERVVRRVENDRPQTPSRIGVPAHTRAFCGHPRRMPQI